MLSARKVVNITVKNPVTFIDITAMECGKPFIINELEDFQMCKESRRFF